MGELINYFFLNILFLSRSVLTTGVLTGASLFSNISSDVTVAEETLDRVLNTPMAWDTWGWVGCGVGWKKEIERKLVQQQRATTKRTATTNNKDNNNNNQSYNNNNIIERVITRYRATNFHIIKQSQIQIKKGEIGLW